MFNTGHWRRQPGQREQHGEYAGEQHQRCHLSAAADPFGMAADDLPGHRRDGGDADQNQVTEVPESAQPSGYHGGRQTGERRRPGSTAQAADDVGAADGDQQDGDTTHLSLRR